VLAAAAGHRHSRIITSATSSGLAPERFGRPLHQLMDTALCVRWSSLEKRHHAGLSVARRRRCSDACTRAAASHSTPASLARRSLAQAKAARYPGERSSLASSLSSAMAGLTATRHLSRAVGWRGRLREEGERIGFHRGEEAAALAVLFGPAAANGLAGRFTGRSPSSRPGGQGKAEGFLGWARLDPWLSRTAVFSPTKKKVMCWANFCFGQKIIQEKC
jgi:hypothetical protein